MIRFIASLSVRCAISCSRSVLTFRPEESRIDTCGPTPDKDFYAGCRLVLHALLGFPRRRLRARRISDLLDCTGRGNILFMCKPAFARSFRGSGGKLPTTRWSEVARAACDGSSDGQTALGSLFMRYRRPLLAHLRRKFGCSPEEADDLLQDFVLRKVLERNLLATANREMGRFRTFLLKALDHFVIQRFRQKSAQKRQPSGGLVSLDELGHDRPEFCREVSGVSFDVDWARAVLTAALEGMRQECERTARPQLWDVFRARILAPILEDEPPVAYEELVERHALGTVKEAANLLTTGKRMFARHLKAVVRETVVDPEDVLGEIRELRAVLALPEAALNDPTRRGIPSALALKGSEKRPQPRREAGG